MKEKSIHDCPAGWTIMKICYMYQGHRSAGFHLAKEEYVPLETTVQKYHGSQRTPYRRGTVADIIQ